MSKVDDYFEKSKNLKLKDEVSLLLEKCPFDFAKIFKEAKDITLKEAGLKPPKYKQRNYMAENMYGNTIGILYDNYPQYMHIDSCGRPYVLLEKNIRIYIKKLSDKYLPSNIKTKHVKKLNAQDLFAEKSQIHVLYAGFVLQNNDWAINFKEVCITYINKVYNNIAAWVIDLRDKAYWKSGDIITYLSQPNVEDSPLISVPGVKEENKVAK